MRITTTACLLLLTLGLGANPVPTPIIPGFGYRVHDVERPHPEKVTGVSALHTTAPSDATVLFDGTSTDAFVKPWPIKDGALVAAPGYLQTKEHFGKCQIHLEYRIPAGREISGQKGGNSGVFIAGKYEIQVQESHTNVTYADGQAGAMYGQYPPLVNPCVEQGEWQSYDIIFEPAKFDKESKELLSPAVVTVLMNGVVLHHAQPFMGLSTFRQVAQYPKGGVPEKGPLKLQWHNDPVEFRNIWIRDLGEYTRK